MTTAHAMSPTAAAQIWHLCRHAVFNQRGRLLAWLAVVCAHPMLAWLAWPGAGAPRVALLFLVLPFVRLLLMTVVVGAIVHDDSPIDDRAFWRTRPVPPGRMAIAKWLTIVAAFVLPQVLIVWAVALTAQVPSWYWPSMLLQVAVTEGALTGLVLVLATRTRHLAALLLATTGVLGLCVLTVNALEQLRRVPWMRDRHLMADATLASWVGLGIVAIAAIGLAIVAYRGHAKRQVFAVSVLATLLGALAPWFIPALRAPRPTPLPLTLDLSGSTVRAERLGAGDERVLLVVEPSIGGLEPTDTAQIFLLDGQLATSGGPREVRRGAEPRFVKAGDGRPQAPVLAVLDAPTFAALAGRPARFTGRFNVDVKRVDTVASAPLEAGRTLAGDVARLRLDEVRRESRLSSWQTLATGLQVYLLRPTVIRWGFEFRLREAGGSCVTTGYPQTLVPFQADVVLPTLARPFSVHRVALSVPPSNCTPDPGRTIVEMRRTQTPPPTAVPVAFSFVVPATADPARTIDRAAVR